MKPKRVVEINFGKKEKGLGYVVNDKYIEIVKYSGEHPACRSCSGCGKGNSCPVI